MRKFLGFLFLLALGACFFLPQVQTELAKDSKTIAVDRCPSG